MTFEVIRITEQSLLKMLQEMFRGSFMGRDYNGGRVMGLENQFKLFTFTIWR